MPRCKSCSAEIAWAHTTDGKAAPFQRDDSAGEWEIDDKGVARKVGKAPAQLELGSPPRAPRYTSHFATCKDADSWRQKR